MSSAFQGEQDTSKVFCGTVHGIFSSILLYTVKEMLAMPKIVKRLSEKAIDNAKPKDKDYKLYDGDGLCLLVRKSGAKVWQYPYTYNSKRNVYTIGKYLKKGVAGHVPLVQARKERHEVVALLDSGVNPNEHKQISLFTRQDTTTTFEVVAREWHAKGTRVDKHARNILRSLERDVFQFIGHMQMEDITARDIISILSNIEDRGALDVAKRTCQRCEAIFDYAIIKGICEINPAAGRSRYIKGREVRHRSHFKEHQLPDFLEKLNVYHGRKYIRLAMHLLVLTFVRPGELRNAVWDEIDFERAVWLIPAGRMKMKRDHVVPLSRQALCVLSELHSITGRGDLLFPSVKSPHRPISDVTLIKVLRIMDYTGDDIVPHGFRHTASTILNEHGFAADVIERQLAHKDQNKIRSTYNHAEDLDERTKMMQWYSDYLDELHHGQNLISS